NTIFCIAGSVAARADFNLVIIRTVYRIVAIPVSSDNSIPVAAAIMTEIGLFIIVIEVFILLSEGCHYIFGAVSNTAFVTQPVCLQPEHFTPLQYGQTAYG